LISAGLEKAYQIYGYECNVPILTSCKALLWSTAYSFSQNGIALSGTLSN